MQEEKKKELSFHLEVFEGPLDLLLKLISKNKINIYDIPIAFIFDQYMEYIDLMREMDMEVAGEFISMAAELMLIKSRMLLPKTSDENEEDPRASLTQALIEYKKAKEAAAFLAERYSIFGDRMTKDTDEIEFDRSYVASQDVEALIKAMDRLLIRKKLLDEARTDEPENNLKHIVSAKITPIHVKVASILRTLVRNKRVDFETIMCENRTKSDLVAAFLALLQLISKKQIRIAEETDEGKMFIEINYERKSISKEGNADE